MQFSAPISDQTAEIDTLFQTRRNTRKCKQDNKNTEQLWVGGGGGAPLVTQYWEGAQNTFSYLILYNFKIIGGGGGGARAPPALLYSAVPAFILRSAKWGSITKISQQNKKNFCGQRILCENRPFFKLLKQNAVYPFPCQIGPKTLSIKAAQSRIVNWMWVPSPSPLRAHKCIDETPMRISSSWYEPDTSVPCEHAQMRSNCEFDANMRRRRTSEINSST